MIVVYKKLQDWSQDPNYEFLTIYSERPRVVRISTMALRQKSKGCTLLISDGFDQLVIDDEWINVWIKECKWFQEPITIVHFFKRSQKNIYK